MRPVLFDTNAYAAFKLNEAAIIEIFNVRMDYSQPYCDWRIVSWF